MVRSRPLLESTTNLTAYGVSSCLYLSPSTSSDPSWSPVSGSLFLGRCVWVLTAVLSTGVRRDSEVSVEDS